MNAIRYSPRAAAITVEASALDGGLLVSVHDQGGGIPPESQERIFERFYRVDQSATRSAGGVGLGLYICRKLSETLGGRLWLERSDGDGSAFALWLPTSPSARPQREAAPLGRDRLNGEIRWAMPRRARSATRRSRGVGHG